MQDFALAVATKVHGWGAVCRCRMRADGRVGAREGSQGVLRGGKKRGNVGHHQAYSDQRVVPKHWVGEAAAKLVSDLMYCRHQFKTTGVATTADGVDDNLISIECLERPYTFMNAYDGRESRDDVQP